MLKTQHLADITITLKLLLRSQTDKDIAKQESEIFLNQKHLIRLI